MRAKSGKKCSGNHSCVLCKHRKCLDERVPKVLFRINPNYTGPITRSVTQLLHYISDFILVEVYRSMPLLGDEDKVPNWDVHIARFAVIFTNRPANGQVKDVHSLHNSTTKSF